MRKLLVLAALLAVAVPAAASDRYGEARNLQAPDLSPPAPGGRTLSWANKTAPSADAPAAYAGPEPLALAAQYMRGRSSGGPQQNDLPPPPGDRRVASIYSSGYQPFTPQEPYRPQAVQPAPRALPGPAAPEPAPQAASLPTSLYSPPPPEAAIGRPQQIAQAAPAAPAASAATGEGVRLYSVHRGYGLSPDAIPAPKGDNYVLIGPSESGLAGGPPSEDSDEPKDGQPF